MDLKEKSVKKDIDLDEGWKIINLKMKELEDKVRLMQVNMKKLHDKYSLSKPVIVLVTRDENYLGCSEAKDENTSNVSAVHDVTLLYEDDRQIQAHKVILSACYPSDLSNIFHENLLKDMLKENISYQSLRINNQVFPVKGPDKTVTPDLFQSQSCVGNCSPPCFLPLLPGGYQDQFFQQEYGQH